MSRILRGDDPKVSSKSDDSSKKKASRALEKGVIDSEVYDAVQKAKAIIEDAEQEAEEIRSKARDELQRAESEAETILEKARNERERLREEGVEEGREQGMAEAMDLLTKAREEHQRLLQSAESDIVQLSVGVARKIIGRELQLDNETIVDIVGQAIQTVRHQREIVIRVNPEDLEALQDNKPELMGLLTRAHDLSLRSDGDLDRGGCMIDTEIGTIDAKLETQLDTLEKILLRRRS